MKMWNRKGEEVEVSEERFVESIWLMRARYPKCITRGLFVLIPEGCLEIKDEAEVKWRDVIIGSQDGC